MKKKIILALLLVAIFTCLFAVAVSATDEFQSIEFKVMLEGETEYTTVYTVSSTDYWNPGISMANKFYTDVERTVEFDKSNIVKIDLRNTVVHSLDESKSPIKTKYITRLSGDANNPYTKVTHFYMPATGIGSIPDSMFKNWTSLEFVDFGGTTQIHDYAFSGCSFTELTIPAQITHFRNGAFSSCTNLQSITILGDGATFGSGILQGCTSLTSVTLTNPATIPGSMFNGCTSLTSYTIPETVTEIGACAFMGTSITSLHIPASVVTIKYQIAEDVTTLKTLTFAPNSNLTKIEHRTFQNSGLEGAIVLPEGLIELGYSAFTGTKITSATLPSTLTTVGSSAFASTSVTEAIIPDSLTSIPSYMFNGCKSLTTVSIPAGFTKIGERAFQGCSIITSLTFRGNAGANAQIDTAAFETCYTIGVVTIPEGVTTLGNGAFNHAGVTHLTLPSTLTTVHSGSTFNVWNSKVTSDYKLVSVTGLENTQITSIPASMFRGQSKWKPETIVLPTTVEHIYGDYAFADVGMSNIVLSPNLKTLGNETFTACTSLKNVYVPGTIETYGSNPFYTRGTHFFVTSSDTDYLAALAAKAGTGENSVSYADYIKNPDNYKSGKWIIYGCNVCETFYKGTHNESAVVAKFLGASYVTDYVHASTCLRCQKSFVVETICGPLFNDLGYTKAEDGTAFSYDLKLNKTNIATYEAKTGKTLNYGFIVGSYTEGETGDIMGLDGKATIQKSVVTDFAGVQFNNLDKYCLKMTGIKADQYEMLIYCNAYVLDGTSVSYMGAVTGDGKALAVSYKTLPAKQ